MARAIRGLASAGVVGVCCVAAAAIVLASGCKRESATADGPAATRSTGGGEKFTIAVIPKGTTHSFWNSVEAGARKAETELGVTVIWKGPLKESEKTRQIEIVEQFVSEGVSGICLAPLDSTALLGPVQTAAEKRIPVVIFDSALGGQVGKDFVGLVATDNKQGGRMAGDELARLLGGKGKVVLLRYQEGHASTGHREAGFLEAIKKHPGLDLIQENRYAGGTASEAQTAAANLLDKLKEADGIFCPNESSTQGMLSALEENGLAGKAKFVGFDTSPPLVEGLRKGSIHALVAQDPVRMGYEAVATMVRHLKGEKVPESIDTGAKLVTKENMETPEIKKLVGG